MPVPEPPSLDQVHGLVDDPDAGVRTTADSRKPESDEESLSPSETLAWLGHRRPREFAVWADDLAVFGEKPDPELSFLGIRALAQLAPPPRGRSEKETEVGRPPSRIAPRSASGGVARSRRRSRRPRPGSDRRHRPASRDSDERRPSQDQDRCRHRGGEPAVGTGDRLGRRSRAQRRHRRRGRKRAASRTGRLSVIGSVCPKCSVSGPLADQFSELRSVSTRYAPAGSNPNAISPSSGSEVRSSSSCPRHSR